MTNYTTLGGVWLAPSVMPNLSALSSSVARLLSRVRPSVVFTVAGLRALRRPRVERGYLQRIQCMAEKLELSV